MPMTVEEALELLRRNAGYNWLTHAGRQLWDVDDVLSALTEAGLKVERSTVISWFKSMPNTQSFGGRGGMYATRDDLLIFFASRVRGGVSDGDARAG